LLLLFTIYSGDEYFRDGLMGWIIVILIVTSIMIAASVLLSKSKMSTKVILTLGLSSLAAATIFYWALVDFLFINGSYFFINVIMGIGFSFGSVCIIAASLKFSRMYAPGISFGAGMLTFLAGFCPIFLSAWWSGTTGTLVISAFLMCLLLLLTGLLVIACSLLRLVRRNEHRRLC
jgi:hypothetical protein